MTNGRKIGYFAAVAIPTVLSVVLGMDNYQRRQDVETLGLDQLRLEKSYQTICDRDKPNGKLSELHDAIQQYNGVSARRKEIMERNGFGE